MNEREIIYQEDAFEFALDFFEAIVLFVFLACMGLAIYAWAT